jgi:hypothetical protein
MTRLGWFVAVAVAAAVAGCGSGSTTKPFTIDEKGGRVGRVALGDSRDDIVGALGKPGEAGTHGGFLPLGEYFEDIGGPPAIPVPSPGVVLRYEHFAALLIDGRVYSMIVSGSARTAAGPGIGDSLATVKKAFRRPYCSSFGTEDGKDLPYCSFPVPAGRIAFGGDPVKSITLTAHPRR